MSQASHLFLGGVTGTQPVSTVKLPPEQFRTHGVILGMTGSGKTGLGIVLLEEAARQAIPSLIFDPKGDMGNLMLNFSGLGVPAFEPWVEAEGGPEGRRQAASQAAQRWRDGTARWGLDFDADPHLRQGPFEMLTPGASNVAPVNLLGTLRAPPGGASAAVQSDDELDALITSLLGLIDVNADPFSSPPYILLNAIVSNAWNRGLDLTWVDLLQQIADPPCRKLGVFQVDDFYPPQERRKLANRLNGLLASPRFKAWCTGTELDFDLLLDVSKPRSTIFYLAHLNESERQMVVSLTLGKLIRWMRSQPGTSGLRALVYMDEVAGYVPPTAMPATKKPILTLLKQARAYGVGLVLSTQNPVDIDYKALSNAGTWLLGRLQTPKDRERALSGFGGQPENRELLERELAGLEKRQFVLYETKQPKPQSMEVRHALSYLRGPLTLAEVQRLCDAARSKSAPSEANEQPSERSEANEVGTQVGLPLMPKVASSVPVRYLSASTPWIQEVGVDFSGEKLAAGLAARLQLRFDERTAALDERIEWEAVWFPLGAQWSARDGVRVDYDARDFQLSAPPSARYHAETVDLSRATYFASIEREIIGELHGAERLSLWRQPKLKLYGRPGESESEFRARCEVVAEERADEQTAKLRDKYERKLERLQKQLRTAQHRKAELETARQSKQQDEWLSGASALLGMFFGGRSNTRALAKAGRRRQRTRSAAQRVEHQEDKVLALHESIEDLEDELQTEVETIAEQWLQHAAEIEHFEIGLEKNDIRVEELVLFWAPTVDQAVPVQE